MKNSEIVKICKEVSSRKNAKFEFVYKIYFLENILLNISQSKYSENFILKGGVYLSNIFGLNTRTTSDAGFHVWKLPLKEQNMKKVLLKALSKEKELSYSIYKMTEIKKNDIYKGIRALVKCWTDDNVSEISKIDRLPGIL